MSRKPIQFEAHPVSFEDALATGRFRGWGEHVVDGDTLDCLLDLGFYQYAYERVRLGTIDTPEIYGVPHDSEEYARGQLASELSRMYVAECPLLVSTYEEETFGRFVGDVWVLDGDGGGDEEGDGTWVQLADLLREAGFAADEDDADDG